MIVIVDYGMGNMLKKVGAASTISSDPAIVEASDISIYSRPIH